MGRDLSLSGAIPGSDLNGLIPLAKKLVDNPMEVRVAVVLFDVSKITTKVDEDHSMPVVRLRAIEPITDPKISAEVRKVMNDLYAERTGKQELDLEYDHSYDAEDPA